MTELQKIASIIDHTLLTPVATPSQIKTLVAEAKMHHFYTVCVPPHYVALAKREIGQAPIGITTVVGFPLGYATSQVKAFEASAALQSGATEIDMVMNLAAFKAHDDATVASDIAAVRQAVRGHVLKVIIETAYLDEAEIKRASAIVLASGADFVKTSTGFASRGAQLSDIKTIKSVVGSKIGIKAAGGVKTLEDARAFVAAGATRIGTSSGVKLMTGVTSTSTY